MCPPAVRILSGMALTVRLDTPAQTNSAFPWGGPSGGPEQAGAIRRGSP